MTDRTAAEVIGDAASDELLDWNGFGLLMERMSDEQIIAIDQAIAGVVVARLHAAGYMIVPRRPTVEMIQDGYDAGRAARSSGVGGQTIEASVRTMGYRELAIYAAMTAEGELK